MSQLTQRQFLFLDDLIHMEEMQVIFAADLAERCQDPEIAQLCAEVARKSEQHFNTLLRQIEHAQGNRSFAQTSSFQSGQTGQGHANFSHQSGGYSYTQ